jgi:hypothetical protein
MAKLNNESRKNKRNHILVGLNPEQCLGVRAKLNDGQTCELVAKVILNVRKWSKPFF